MPPDPSEGRDQQPDPRLEGLRRLIEIVDRLRAPDGCPWDRSQTLRSMAPNVLEEAYEVVDALRAGVDRDTVGELGDLLMNILLIARIGQDEGRFSAADVAEQVADKLVRRHPHVFGDEDAGSEAEALARWEAIKRAERSGADAPEQRSALAGVPADLPALLRAFRVGQKAAQTGFDWPDLAGPLAKLEEELGEMRTELAAERRDEQRIQEEFGDVLFSMTNLARHLGIDPEMALRDTIDRFSDRFGAIERHFGERIEDASLEEMEAVWVAAKHELSENRRKSDS